MKWLKWLLWFLPVVTPFYLIRFSFGPLPTTAFELFLLLLFSVFLWVRGWGGVVEGWERLGRWRWPVIAWFGVTILAVFFAPDVFKGLGLWRAYVLEPLLVFVILADVIRTEEDRSTVFYSLFILPILLFVWALVQFLTGYGIPHPWDVAIAAGRRATGPYPYPNALALMVVPIGALAFGWLVSGIRKHVSRIENRSYTRYLIPATCYFATLGSAILAKSDGGLIALLAVTIIGLLLIDRTRWWTVGASVVVGLAVIFSPVRDPVWKEVTFQSWSGQVRLFQWRETRQMLHDHWFFGAGFGGYPTVFKPYHRATAIEIFQYPHNILLNFWTETGVLGVLVMGLILTVWVSSIRYQVSGEEEPHTRYLIPATKYITLAPLLAIVIHGLVDVPYFKNDLAIVFWMLVFVTTVGLETKKTPEGLF